MWISKGHGTRKVGEGNGLVAVAIDKDKGSQNALKWAVENLLSKGQTVVLIHVFNKPSLVTGHGAAGDNHPGKQQIEKMVKDLFLTFRCYCTRKDVHCLDVVLESTDIAKAITEYVSHAAIEILVLGTPSRSGFMRKFKADVPTTVSRGAPDFCTVYVVSKGKVSTMRNASRAAPFVSPLLDQIHNQQHENNLVDNSSEAQYKHSLSITERMQSFKPHPSVDETFRSPLGRGKNGQNQSVRSFADLMSETDISFVSSSRPSTDRMSSVTYDFMDSGLTPRISTSSDTSFASIHSGPKFTSPQHGFSSISHDSGGTSFSGSAHSLDDMESEMRRLKLELKQTMDLYGAACREALTAKQKLNRWRIEEERRLEEARFSEEAALSIIEHEKARCREAIEAAEAAKKRAEIEAQRRVNIEKALREAAETKKAKDNLAYNDIRYRRYSIEEIEAATEYFTESKKIGEGGYGPVYKCYLDHTPVAVKVLRPDAAQGRTRTIMELKRLISTLQVEVLSLIRHPNMVLLLGACPEYGILVYEYMARGSLEDRLFKRGNTPPLSWQIRFRIAAEIATGLLFLHQTKPEPLVHRDLKPGNILLDNNYTSKISDVGLARLVPATAENVTQYHLTSAAGTFCYIDPEYQQTGMLGVKSDVYSLGIMLLQIITAKPPMGLTHLVEQAIENGTFKDILDPEVPDWPVEETLRFAKIALQCAELRRKDRPDLGTTVVEELEKLRELAEEKLNYLYFAGAFGPSPNHSQASITPPLSQISMTPTNLSQTSMTPTNLSQASITQLKTVPSSPRGLFIRETCLLGEVSRTVSVTCPVSFLYKTLLSSYTPILYPLLLLLVEVMKKKQTEMGQGEEVKTKSEAQVEILERGEIFFFYRPKVDKEEVHSPDDVQRLYLVLRPESGERAVEVKQDTHSGKQGFKKGDHGGSSSTGKNESDGGQASQEVNIEKEPLLRYIVMGRKSLPDPRKRRQPYWGFVDLVTTKIDNVKNALKGGEYDTATRGHRHRYPARAVGEGIYRIVRHNPGKRIHTHLVYKLELPSKDKDNQPQESLNIEREGSFIIQIKNPDQHGGRSQFRGLQNKRKAMFPAHLQGQLGHRKFVPADPPDMLNYEGCELLLISASDDIEEELGMELKTECEDDDDDDPASCSDLVRTFGEIVPTSPLLKGTWS
ncbi:unnamed protein product [Dovyalis caffra]|uniref:RING-type E3 ubiquitin transferase n=1 Tax=Dovyalis caffra TaxID=77055 RepID=A0AAV1RVJ0_9ROSI|nr:unnamed protein product [Dovyalis caffra]